MYLPLFIQYNTLSAGLPFWAVSLNMVSGSPRTKYSGEPEPYWLLAKAKAWLEILKGCGIYNVRSGRILFRIRNSFLNVLRMYSLESDFPSQSTLCIPICLEILKGCGIYNGRFGRASCSGAEDHS